MKVKIKYKERNSKNLKTNMIEKVLNILEMKDKLDQLINSLMLILCQEEIIYSWLDQIRESSQEKMRDRVILIWDLTMIIRRILLVC